MSDDLPKFSRDEKILRKEKTRRKVRQAYAELERQAQTNRKEYVKPEAGEELGRLLEKQHKLFESVTHAREGTIDTRLFHRNTDFLVKQVTNISIGKSIDVKGFVDNLLVKYSKTVRSEDSNVPEIIDVDWERVGKDVCKYFMRPPVAQFMNGPIAMKKKERRKGKRTKRVDGIGEQPKVIEEDQSKEGNEKYIRKLNKKFKKLQKEKNDGSKEVSFLDLCIDKGEKGFTKSIENIFYYSFLIKDNIASLRMKKKKLYCNIDTSMGKIEDKPERQQSIFQLDLDSYNKIVAKMNNGDFDEEMEDEESEEEEKTKKKKKKSKKRKRESKSKVKESSKKKKTKK